MRGHGRGTMRGMKGIKRISGDFWHPRTRRHQQVEVVVLAEEGRSINLVRELREVLQTTQGLPQAQAISEDEIAAEIATYRSGR